MKDRFFVDLRVGIGAIRDRLYTDPDYAGLHSDTEGVVSSFSGVWDGEQWSLPEWVEESLTKVCDCLNSGEFPYEPNEDWTRYICDAGHTITYDWFGSGSCECDQSTID